MAGELIVSEVATPSTPASGKQSIFMSSDTPARFKRVDGAGNVYVQQEMSAIALAADYTLTNSGGAAEKIFNSPTNGQVTLPASTSWEFDMQILLSNVGTTSHTWALLFAGTATITALDYSVRGRSGITSALTLTADSSAFQSNAAGSLPTTALVATAASTSATEFVILNARGILRINAAGTFIPQIKASSATGSTAKILRGSFFRMTPLGSDTVASVGNWS